MMMRRGYIILLSGAALLVAGIVISTVWGISFASSFMTDNTVFDASIEPGGSVDARRDVSTLDRPLSVAVGIDPQRSQANGSRLSETVTDPDGNVVSSSEFGESFFTTINPEVAGTYTVTISNLGTEPVTIGGTFGHMPFIGADGKPNLDNWMSVGGLGTIIAGGVLATAGVVVLIAGVIVTVIDGRKRDGTTTTTNTTTTGEGGITYRKD